MTAVLCLDIGSTWTKGALVSGTGALLGSTQHPTSPPEVWHGVEQVISSFDADLDAPAAEILACSSAGGGLRLAVVGQERLVSVEAGQRVALSAGAKVVHVAAGELDGAALRELHAARPDVLLLVGGTDGGDEKVLLHNAEKLAAARLRVPVVLAGNVAARSRAAALLAETCRTVVPADNVLPDVGEIAPEPARAAIREVFLRHVIGGKQLSNDPRFFQTVRAVTPEVVAYGVAALANVLAAQEDQPGAVLVVDVGGATTDVYSSVSTVEEESDVVALPADRRTVEGDLGMRVSAPGVVVEAEAEGLLAADEIAKLAGPAAVRAELPAHTPSTVDEEEVELRLAALAAIIALRRHLRMVRGRLGPHGAARLVLSGGVFRHARQLSAVTTTLRADPVLRPVLRSAEIVVDRRAVLGPAGLLAAVGRGQLARALVGGELA